MRQGGVTAGAILGTTNHDPGDPKGKPRLLDLFCGAGGCAKGYQRAGFYVVGVDITDQPRYCGDEFIQADAIEFLRSLLNENDRDDVSGVLPFERMSSFEGSHGVGELVGTVEHPAIDANHVGHLEPPVGVAFDSPHAGKFVKGFDAIHASPPCQAYSMANNVWKRDHPKLIEPVRELLLETGLPYVIENVPGAPLIDPVTICGLSVGVNVKRHRLFETNWPLMVPPCHSKHAGDWLLVWGHTVQERGHVVRRGPTGNTTHRKHVGTDRGREAMGIDWMNRDELSDAIPPAYTELIGHQLMQHIEARAAA